jgi:HK97 family phage portal protein
MGFLRRSLGLETLTNAAPEGDHSADVAPPDRARSAAVVTTERALTLPAVLRSIQIIAGIGATLILEAWRGGDRVNPTPSLLLAPDPWRSLSSFLERLLVCLCTNGNAFLLKHRSVDRRVVAVEVLDPNLVFIETVYDSQGRDTGRKQYRYFKAGKSVLYTGDDIEHVWGLEIPGFTRGLSPIGWCARAVNGMLDVRDYADNWFTEGDVPSGLLTTDQPMVGQSAKEYKRLWIKPDPDDPDYGRTGPRVRVLGHGLHYEHIALNPAEAQWLESSKASVLDVARMFGLPGDYLLAAVEGSSLTYSNLEMIDAQFLRLTLFPVYLRKIEAAFTNISPNGQTVRFNTEPLLRPDAKSRSEIDRAYIDAGVYDGRYVRERDGITIDRPLDPPPPRLRPAVDPAQEGAPA